MDIADIADGLIAQERDEGVRRAAEAVAGKGTVFCTECEEVIPIERSIALPSARTCVECQQAAERAAGGR